MPFHWIDQKKGATGDQAPFHYLNTFTKLVNISLLSLSLVSFPSTQKQFSFIISSKQCFKRLNILWLCT